MAIDGDSLYMNHESSSPSTQYQNSDDGGGDVFYRELRRRKIGTRKAREIATKCSDQAHTLHLIDTRPNPNDPNSLGRIITDILDGVAGDYVAPVALASSHTPATPPAPTNGLSAEQLRELKAKHDYTRRS